MRGIIVAFSDQKGIQKIAGILEQNNFFVKGTATNASMVLRMISPEDGGGLIVCGSRFADMMAVQLYDLLPEDYDMLLLSSMSTGLELPYNAPDGFFTLALPLQTRDLIDSIRMLLKTRQMYRDTRIPFVKKANALPVRPDKPPERPSDEKKLIEEAKAILIMRNNMSEQEAHRFLQKRSMGSGMKIMEMAKLVVDNQNGETFFE